MEGTAKTTQEIFNTWMMCFQEQGSLKVHFHYKLLKAQNYTKPFPGTWHMHFKSCSEKNYSDLRSSKYLSLGVDRASE